MQQLLQQENSSNSEQQVQKYFLDKQEFGLKRPLTPRSSLLLQLRTIRPPDRVPTPREALSAQLLQTLRPATPRRMMANLHNEVMFNNTDTIQSPVPVKDYDGYRKDVMQSLLDLINQPI